MGTGFGESSRTDVSLSLVPYPVVSYFSEANAVPAGVSTDVLTFHVDSSQPFFLLRVDVGGENVAVFDVLVGDSTIARSRIWHTTFTQRIEFSDGTTGGFYIPAASIIKVKVLHNRPWIGNFEARLQGRYSQ
jgi:hypothetical protein